MSENLVRFALFFPVFLFSLSFHEWAHAWSANRLGDPTARLSGRMTLNPLAHIDPVGTFLFPLLMFMVPGLMLIGWARPVPIDTRNLKGRNGPVRVALAGPVSNLFLAVLFAACFHLFFKGSDSSNSLLILQQMFETGVILNLMLAFFNLIPIPPLDGAAVLTGFLSPHQAELFHRLSQYSFLILFLALYLGVLRFLTIPVYGIARILLS